MYSQIVAGLIEGGLKTSLAKQVVAEMGDFIDVISGMSFSVNVHEGVAPDVIQSIKADTEAGIAEFVQKLIEERVRAEVLRLF